MNRTTFVLARPSSGKTFFLLQKAAETALENKKTLFISTGALTTAISQRLERMGHQAALNGKPFALNYVRSLEHLEAAVKEAKADAVFVDDAYLLKDFYTTLKPTEEIATTLVRLACKYPGTRFWFVMQADRVEMKEAIKLPFKDLSLKIGERDVTLKVHGPDLFDAMQDKELPEPHVYWIEREKIQEPA